MLAQVLGSLGLGGALGATIAKKIAITDLPQMVGGWGRSTGGAGRRLGRGSPALHARRCQQLGTAHALAASSR